MESVTSLQQWMSDPHYAAWLTKTLASKEGRLLMGVLSEMAVPSEDFASMDGVDVVQKMALRHCHVSGQQTTIRNILGLSQPPIEPQTLEEWTE